MDKNTFSEAFFTMFIGGAFYLGIFALILTCSKENKIKRALQKPKRSIFILINIIYLLLLSFLTTAKYSDYYLNLRFDRKMKILGPVLSGKQEKELIAQWATMKSYHDYLMIENTLNNFAQNNNIVEPKSLWKKSK
jgi:Trk-type K+ transport system membrane component